MCHWNLNYITVFFHDLLGNQKMYASIHIYHFFNCNSFSMREHVHIFTFQTCHVISMWTTKRNWLEFVFLILCKIKGNKITPHTLLRLLVHPACIREQNWVANICHLFVQFFNRKPQSSDWSTICRIHIMNSCFYCHLNYANVCTRTSLNNMLTRT